MSEIIKDKLLKVNKKIFDDYVKINGKTVRLVCMDIDKQIADIKNYKDRTLKRYNRADNLTLVDCSIYEDTINILEKEGYKFDLSKCTFTTIYADTSEERIYIDGEEFVYKDNVVPKKLYLGDFVIKWENLFSSFKVMNNIAATAKADNYRKLLEDKYASFLFEDVQKELKEVESEINKIAEKGFYSTRYDGNLYYQTVKELEKAGYKVSYEDVTTEYKKVTVTVDGKDKVIEVKTYKGRFHIDWCFNKPYYSFDIREVE